MCGVVPQSHIPALVSDRHLAFGGPLGDHDRRQHERSTSRPTVSPSDAAPEGNMRRVLVTGGTGFIGSHVVERLLHAGDSVIVLDNSNRQATASGGETRRGSAVPACIRSRVETCSQRTTAGIRPMAPIHIPGLPLSPVRRQGKGDVLASQQRQQWVSMAFRPFPASMSPSGGLHQTTCSAGSLMIFLR